MGQITCEEEKQYNNKYDESSLCLRLLFSSLRFPPLEVRESRFVRFRDSLDVRQTCLVFHVGEPKVQNLEIVERQVWRKGRRERGSRFRIKRRRQLNRDPSDRFVGLRDRRAGRSVVCNVSCRVQLDESPEDSQSFVFLIRSAVDDSDLSQSRSCDTTRDDGTYFARILTSPPHIFAMLLAFRLSFSQSFAAFATRSTSSGSISPA